MGHPVTANEWDTANRPVCESADDTFLPADANPGSCSDLCPVHGCEVRAAYAVPVVGPWHGTRSDAATGDIGVSLCGIQVRVTDFDFRRCRPDAYGRGRCETCQRIFTNGRNDG